MQRNFYIVTDGLAIGNPGPGAWAAILRNGHNSREMSGSSPWTTISEMELLAAVQALRSVSLSSRVELCSDSQYLIFVVRFHAARWSARGWRNCRGQALQHRDLWQELLHLDQAMDVRWRWIKGHAGHPAQCRADEIAYQAARAEWEIARVSKRAA